MIEDELKRRAPRHRRHQLLELGIDMGGRSRHQVESPGAVSRHAACGPGRSLDMNPTARCTRHRGDLRSAVVAQRMVTARSRPRFLRNPLDVLAQQVVARRHPSRVLCQSVAARTPLRKLCRAQRRSASASHDLLAGRYPNDGFNELRPDRGSFCGHAARPRRLQAVGRHQQRHHPRSACTACSYPTALVSASSTRRWSTRAGPARPSCSGPAPGGSRRSRSSGSP